MHKTDLKISRSDIQFAAWAIGTLLVLVLLTPYMVNPPLTLARLGEVAGVVGFVLIVACMLLMIRLPRLAALMGGLESLYSLHRGVGLAAYGFILLHPLLLAQQGGWQVLTLEGKDLAYRLGWTGLLVLMLVLVCTFILKTRGYAIWRRLHTLSVLAFLAMAGHAVAYQSDWPLAGRVAFNLCLFAGLLAPLLRFWLVDRGGVSSAYRVNQVGYPASEVIDMHLSPVGDGLDIVPGQFVFVRFQTEGDYPGCGHFHPFTASGVMDDGALRLSIKANGACTRLMQHIQPGAQARLQGPYGELFQNARQDMQVWVAAGIGITPFLARVRALDRTHVPVRLFYFFDSVQEAAYLEELDALVRTKDNLSFHPMATYGVRDNIGAIFDAMLPPWDDKHYILCGPDAFIEFIRVYLMRNGVSPTAIFDERFEFR